MKNGGHLATQISEEGRPLQMLEQRNTKKTKIGGIGTNLDDDGLY